ncbi:MAG TPA: ThiF family adenylyltransferase [Bacilli bacterium]|nr:ThiF family adenylyltransferase [Bacilli bacterium]
MIDISRHRELFDAEKFNTPITIIGAGATGSWVTLALAKLGIENITVYDFDVVEEHNIANQLYNIEQINEPKVHALKNFIKVSTRGQIKIHNEKFTNQRLSGIVFLMVDSMKQRKLIWENSIKMKTAVQLLIEPRMGLDVGRIYNVEPTNLTHVKRYEDTYYTDEEAEVSACGNTMSVITSSLAIASWCVRQLINWHNHVELNNEILLDFKYNNIFTTTWER